MQVGLDLPEKYYGAVKGMLNVLLPELEIARITEGNNFTLQVKTTLNTTEGIKVVSSIVENEEYREEIVDQEILANEYNEHDVSKRCRNRVKLSIYRLLADYLEQPLSPWGILIGVRPTKLVHSLWDRGFSQSQIDHLLADVYGLAPKKRELLLTIVAKERKYLPTPQEATEKISLYVGIPFCPTRCAYCSFASYPLTSHEEYLADFLSTLEYEIKELGRKVVELGLTVDTLYFGGGTPTILSAKQLKSIISQLKKEFPLADLREFTIEAGRPDTITADKLQTFQQAGVDRISINPQTMNQATLDRIERQHTTKQVRDSFYLARELGFDNINMDLIIGLPGEQVADVEATLAAIKKLAPASLTVHTLAVKRAARLDDQVELPSGQEVTEMLTATKKLARELGLEPYYMYRQKNTVGNLENIGYAQPGLESIYNILMMEERQTVIGLGGGAFTKLIDPEDWSLEREINPKFPAQYIAEVKTRTNRKIEKLTSLIR